MKAIGVGNEFRIYDDTLQVFPGLPAQTYNLRFDPHTGFFFEKRSDLEINEKVYGVHLDKVNKVLDSFWKFERSLGVILSGNKGIGKSLFAKMLAGMAVKSGYPVIIADRYIPGIASYLESLEQEVVVLFDEFDKTFGKANRQEETRNDPQTEMLTLFDGVAVGKKLFIITCNKIDQLNDYLINRPGRFHYHFRFDYPDAGQIREYLSDTLVPDYQGEIDKVIAFARKIDLNYDCLRSIAFELNRGETFESAIQDLNIINTQSESYRVELHWEDGRRMIRRRCFMDLFDREEDESISFGDATSDDLVTVTFSHTDCVYHAARDMTVVGPENLKLEFSDYEDDAQAVASYKTTKPACLLIARDRAQNIHYMI